MQFRLDYGLVLSGDYLRFLVHGALTTVGLSVAAWLLAIVLAVVLTGLRASGNRWAERGVSLYVDYHRSVPLLVQLFVWYFAVPQLLPQGLNTSINESNAEIAFATLALALYSAAYTSEDFRSALRAIPRGQFEAARAVGLSHLGALRWAIFPQVWRLSMPPLVNQALVLFKGTSLASAVGVAELSYQARAIEGQSFRAFEAYSVVTLLYMVGTFSIMYFGARLAQRVQLKTR